MKIILETPDFFNYDKTIRSHGWASLKPFSYDRDTQILSRCHRLKDGTLMNFSVKADKKQDLEIEIDAKKTLTNAQIDALKADIRRIFNVNRDLSAFHEAMKAFKGYEWAKDSVAGRMLLAPTVWENMAKILFTTNTTWAQTKGMSEHLCLIGDTYKDQHTFPTAEQVAQSDPTQLAETIRAGYRMPSLQALAQTIASGKVDVESWFDITAISSQDLYKAITAFKGFGDYSAASLMGLLGHTDRLSLDSIARNVYEKVTGERADDKTIRAYYDKFGQWKELALWMDVEKYEV
ncbi:hypothetical protein MASR2M15_04450 [Anaerolineales bacterium]